MSHHEENELWIAVEPTCEILTWYSCMPGASRCCNLVIAALHKVDFANTQRYCSPACLLMSYRWNTSTKTVIRPKRIKDIVIRKRLYLKMGETSDEGECREFTIPIEIHNFDPRWNLQRTMTGECLTNILYTFFKSYPNAFLSESVEGIIIP